MNIKELIEQLSTMDPEMQVMMQKDAEGTGYSPLSGCEPSRIYDARWLAWMAQAPDMDQEEWEEILKMPHACVLFPVN